MKGTARNKVVTSGRLTGGAKVQLVRRRLTSNPAAAAAAGPQPDYSLYSTDSEDQVTSLHKGLDRCAALLSGILQAEKAGQKSFLTSSGDKGGAAKSRASASRGKKTVKNTKTGHKSCQSVQREPTTRQSQEKQPPSPGPPPQPQTSTLHAGQSPLPQAAPEAAHARGQAERDGEEAEFVPVRDTDPQSAATDAHAAVGHTRSHKHTCSLKTSELQPELQPEPGQDGRGAETEVGMKTVQHLLGELKALIAGQGSAAERLLTHLQQVLSSPLMNVRSSDVQTEVEPSSLHSQNTQLRRRVRTLNQQLKEKEKAERRQNMETLCDSEVFTLQEELTAAQCRLQELQQDLTELRKALEDTQSRLADREAENALMKTDLEATRSRLLQSEREKTDLSLLVQRRLAETGNAARSQRPPGAAAVLVSDTTTPAEPHADRITHFLLSLGQLERTERVCVAAGKPTSGRPTDTLSQPDVRSDQSRCSDRSDWSVRSGSTFDTRDEAAFRDGLAALDASIESLQKTIEVDLRR